MQDFFSVFLGIASAFLLKTLVFYSGFIARAEFKNEGKTRAKLIK